MTLTLTPEQAAPSTAPLAGHAPCPHAPKSSLDPNEQTVVNETRGGWGGICTSTYRGPGPAARSAVPEASSSCAEPRFPYLQPGAIRAPRVGEQDAAGGAGEASAEGRSGPQHAAHRGQTLAVHRAPDTGPSEHGSHTAPHPDHNRTRGRWLFPAGGRRSGRRAGDLKTKAAGVWQESRENLLSGPRSGHVAVRPPRWLT